MNDGSNSGPGGGGDDRVTITVDGKGVTLPKKHWKVAELKAQLHIDPAKVLAEITATGLNDLDDGANIDLHNGQRFMSHARSGGSS